MTEGRRNQRETSAKSRCLSFLERLMGVEPTYAAWEAAVLPMNYSRVCFRLLYQTASYFATPNLLRPERLPEHQNHGHTDQKDGQSRGHRLSALLGDHPRQSRKARQRPGEHCQSQAVKAKQQGQQASDYQLASKELWIRHRDGGQVLYGGVGVLLVNRHPPIIREMGRNS